MGIHRFQFTVVCAVAAVALLSFGCSTSDPLQVDTDVDSETATTSVDSESGSDTNKDCDFNDPCGDHGTCNDQLGVVICDCDDGWKGTTCNQCAANYHLDDGVCVLNENCMPNSCDGNGSCDDSDGTVKCTCNTGYTGTYCDSCATGYHFEANECVADESCATADPCGDNGTCSDTGGVIVCACSDGYTGDTCNQCSSGYHLVGEACVKDEVCMPNTCSGSGTCADSTGVVICTCDTGYAGDYCDACDTDYHLEGSVCVADEVCEVGSCNERGSCVDTTGAIVCECDEGWSGDTCDSCRAGYHEVEESTDAGAGDAGAGDFTCEKDEKCLANSCSGQGTCADTGGVVVCTCDEGHDPADFCATCVDEYHLEGADCEADETCVVGGGNDSCNENGSCDASTGAILCECDTGWDGDSCNVCASGYHLDGENCVLDQQCLPTSCSGNGTCSVDSGVVVCVCDGNFSAASYCSSCITGFHVSGDVCVLDESCPIPNTTPSTSCNSHGSCDDSTKEIICICDTGWTGDTCTTCANGFHTEGEECVLDQTCIPSSCSGHGTCVDTTGVVVCTCETGYDATSYCADCVATYHKKNGLCVEDQYCVLDPPESHSCSSHGTCDDTTGEIECACDEGWGGAACATCANGFHLEGASCVRDENCGLTSCGDHGVSCDDSSGVVVCTCEDGWDPATYCADCSTGYHDESGACLVNEVCVADSCSNHGSCNDSTGIIVCTCDAGYEGDTCGDCTVDYSECSTECCSASQVCYENSCCNPKTCDDLASPEECGETSQDDGCGGTVNCGDCGANGSCSGNTCTCDVNFGVLSGGHECVWACDGFLPDQGCCDGGWLIFCAGQSMQEQLCSIFPPPDDTCGWSTGDAFFVCGGLDTTPVEQSIDCPANIVPNKEIPECTDDDKEDDDWTDNTATLLTLVGGTIDLTGVSCGADPDLFRIVLAEGDNLTVTATFNSWVDIDLILWYGERVDADDWGPYRADDFTFGGTSANMTYLVPAGEPGTYYIEVGNAYKTASGGYALNVTVN